MLSLAMHMLHVVSQEALEQMIYDFHQDILAIVYSYAKVGYIWPAPPTPVRLNIRPPDGPHTKLIAHAQNIVLISDDAEQKRPLWIWWSTGHRSLEFATLAQLRSLPKDAVALREGPINLCFLASSGLIFFKYITERSQDHVIYFSSLNQEETRRWKVLSMVIIDEEMFVLHHNEEKQRMNKKTKATTWIHTPDTFVTVISLGHNDGEVLRDWKTPEPWRKLMTSEARLYTLTDSNVIEWIDKNSGESLLEWQVGQEQRPRETRRVLDATMIGTDAFVTIEGSISIRQYDMFTQVGGECYIGLSEEEKRDFETGDRFMPCAIAATSDGYLAVTHARKEEHEAAALIFFQLQLRENVPIERDYPK